MNRESYGEDIAETETERSTGNSEEDNYEDSFIDDSDPKVVPSSPVSNDEGMIYTLYVLLFVSMNFHQYDVRVQVMILSP